MKITKRFRYWGKRARAFLHPIKNLESHLRLLTRRTSKGLGFLHEVSKRLEHLTKETCQEIGIANAIQPIPKINQ